VVLLNADGMQGMKRFDARKRIEVVLREAGLYRGEVDHEMLLPVCRSVVATVICSVVDFLCQIYKCRDNLIWILLVICVIMSPVFSRLCMFRPMFLTE